MTPGLRHRHPVAFTQFTRATLSGRVSRTRPFVLFCVLCVFTNHRENIHGSRIPHRALIRPCRAGPSAFGVRLPAAFTSLTLFNMEQQNNRPNGVIDTIEWANQPTRQKQSSYPGRDLELKLFLTYMVIGVLHLVV